MAAAAGATRDRLSVMATAVRADHRPDPPFPPLPLPHPLADASGRYPPLRHGCRAGGVHEEVDGRPHPRLSGGALEATAGDGVRVVRAVERVHGGGEGRLLPNGPRRGDVGVGGQRVRWWTLLAGDGARDGELDRWLRGGARAHYPLVISCIIPPVPGVRTPSGGYGKGLLRPLTALEKEGTAESHSPPPMKVKRHLTHPPIVRAAGQFQGDEVKSPEPSVHKLASQVKKLRKENIELRDRNAELGVELFELRNNVDTLSHGFCAKIKRAFVEMGKENKYYAN
uniref:Uncharacterized protein n=2 Tax=Oryza sativa subsp. japonica TaxID=39947 RepID=Q94HM7_ORYSJ|nr:Hypothetical protein [Oryza sativa Japonica Group]AAP52271.1 hypothetical protein LOC_Os10g08240 [Oryza sativa Japonica Group]